MKIDEARRSFELLAISNRFPVDRNEHGEYSFPATYNMWLGFWLAKVHSNELIGDDAKWENAHNGVAL